MKLAQLFGQLNIFREQVRHDYEVALAMFDTRDKAFDEAAGRALQALSDAGVALDDVTRILQPQVRAEATQANLAGLKSRVLLLRCEGADGHHVVRSKELIEELETSIAEMQRDLNRLQLIVSAGLSRESCERVGADIKPFPQNIQLVRESATVVQASKRSPDGHLGAEGA